MRRVFLFLLATPAVFGCMATENHEMPEASTQATAEEPDATTTQATEKPRICCASDILDPRSTAESMFTPLLETCPDNTQIICESRQGEATIILANGEERVLATSETFSEIVIECEEGNWRLEDDADETPPIAKVLCNEIA
uniref:C6 domain-containing protein n=1 Tax=Steinernema glaseri TaxID=37863 RepID=A0A1I7Z8I2_9BILA